MLLFACLFNAPDPNQFQTLKSLTTERWRLRRWPCFCGLSPSGWKRHEPRWKRSWAQAWSTPAWLSERTSTFSAECAALQGRPVVTILEIFSSEGWEGSWSRERISTFPNMLETLTLSSLTRSSEHCAKWIMHFLALHFASQATYRDPWLGVEDYVQIHICLKTVHPLLLFYLVTGNKTKKKRCSYSCIYIFKAVKLEMNSTKRTILFVILLTLKHYNTLLWCMLQVKCLHWNSVLYCPRAMGLCMCMLQLWAKVKFFLKKRQRELEGGRKKGEKKTCTNIHTQTCRTQEIVAKDGWIDSAGMCRWRTTCTDLTDTRHPGDEQLAKEFVFHRHLGEEKVDFVVLAICSIFPFSDHVGENETGFWEESRERYW